MEEMKLSEGRSREVQDVAYFLVCEGMKNGNYEYIRKAMKLCGDDTGVWGMEADGVIMIGDDYFSYEEGKF